MESILNNFIQELNNEKNRIKQQLGTLDLSTISIAEIDERFITPFSKKYLLTTPAPFTTNPYLSDQCIVYGIECFQEINNYLDELYKRSNISPW